MVSRKLASAQSVRTLRLRLRLRVKDKHAPMLAAQAREVNFVWNYCNELSLKTLQREDRLLE